MQIGIKVGEENNNQLKIRDLNSSWNKLLSKI